LAAVFVGISVSEAVTAGSGEARDGTTALAAGTATKDKTANTKTSLRKSANTYPPYGPPRREVGLQGRLNVKYILALKFCQIQEENKSSRQIRGGC
jgi:X-X-X-Leu-X-X-Gly heptad repeat protein